MITACWKIKVATRIRTAGVLFVLTMYAPAQPTVPESFDVASVKLPAGRSQFHFATTPNSLSARGVLLGYCIRWAYGLRLLQRYQVAGPDWLEPGGEWVQYDIEARTAGPVTPAQMRLMMRNLLAERWKLAVHRETRVMPVYVMSVAKGGPKLRKSENEGDVKRKPNGTALEFVGGSMADLAEFMELQVAALIVDETGLTGRYDFTVDYMNYAEFALSIPGSRAADFGPAFNQSLYESGLKLEWQKRPIEVLVIDHVEKTPAEN